MQALFYVAAFLVSFTVSNAIENGETPEQAKNTDAQNIAQIQRPADEQTDVSPQPSVWVLPSLGSL